MTSISAVGEREESMKNARSSRYNSRSSSKLRSYCRRVVALSVKSAIVVACVFYMPTFAEAIPERHEKCLASAVYHEARGESTKAQRAVVDVIVHRAVESGMTYCQVVSEKSQFSWYKRHGIKRYDTDQKELLYSALTHKRVLKDENFKFFYSGRRPRWALHMACKPIGKLTFCKEKNG
jgi:spore germination cell wall hydrolase CwlJ-like protein